MILPFVRELFADAEQSQSFARLVAHLKAGAGRISVSGLTPTAKTLYLTLLRRALQRPLLLLVADNRIAEEIVPMLAAFGELTGAIAPDAVTGLPAYDVLPFENLSPHPEIQEARASALWKISSGAAQVVVAPAAAAAMRHFSTEYYAGLARIVRRGEALDQESLLQHLQAAGYFASDLVEMPGQFALRGGILDVYSPEADRPVRIEFFGDEVESIRKFDPRTQRSSAPVDEAVLLPLTETPASEHLLAPIDARLSRQRVQGPEELLGSVAVSGGAAVFPGWELYAPIGRASNSLFDLLPDPVVFVDEPPEIKREMDVWWQKVEAAHERSGVGGLVRPEELYFPPQDFDRVLERHPGGTLQQLAMEGTNALQLSFHTQSTRRFHGSIAAMVEEVRKLTAEGQRLIFTASNTGEMERLSDLFTEYGLPFRLGTTTAAAGQSYFDEAAYFAADLSTTAILKAFVPDGVALPEARLVMFGTRDLFDESEVVVTRPLRQKSKVSAFLSDFRDLSVGDFVVHVEHGIGCYLGLKEIAHPEMRSDDSATEFMLLEYAEDAKLYVPLTRLDLVQKYRSSGGTKPQLSRLGSAAWTRTKGRVKKAMEDMADDLLKLYAARKTAEGHAFAPDSEWQREFDDAFEHNETEDQAQAIADVKRDMESSQPMDRLLCGDVGYGKTEVAMRAAFKAVADNKQVAVLAPTTVLAFQHFETFKQRFAAFPVNIEMISRFRTAKQQKAIVEKVEQGKVDILIGTHRLLSKDIKFHDLGLLVVDEEQRFGVRHKERLKQLKREVDVLTMSATPIPRTLHMSLVGLRDMSLIETPPKDRIAIQTVVATFDEKVVKSALEHELERGGQVYFLHNRVDSIYEIAAKIQELAPAARVVVGHGQMSEGELEQVMLKFIRHKADVLVATTIIENGLDIPLCNTILINRADRFGLSELYQLRGRVGRSNRRAYAYLFVPAEGELTALARRRLAALKEFSDLGAGFKIAALDLELRGAGNLLGGQQSGHIDAVGFELYISMLERTVRELKGEEGPVTAETRLNLGLDLRIPPDYIPEENQRLRVYKRVGTAENEAQLADVRAEIEDRFGAPPASVQNLLDYADLKLLCQRQGVIGIERRRQLVELRFGERAAVDAEKLARFVAAEPGSQFTPSGTLKFTLQSLKPEEILARLRVLLQALAVQSAEVT